MHIRSREEGVQRRGRPRRARRVLRCRGDAAVVRREGRGDNARAAEMAHRMDFFVKPGEGAKWNDEKPFGSEFTTAAHAPTPSSA